MAVTLADAFIRLRPDARQLGTELRRDTEQAADGAGTNAGHHFGRTMASALKKAAIGAALGAVVAGAAAGRLATQAVAAASDLNETVSKTQVIFGKTSQAVLDFSDTAATSFGISKQSALDASASFALFAKSAGLSGNQVVGFSTKMTGLASDLASFFNTSPEDAIQAIGAAMRGESEPIRRYNVLLDDATLRQAALRLGLVKTTTQALTPQQRILAAQAEILRQTSAAQGDFARTSGGLANQQRIAAAAVANLRAKIGTALLPVVTSLAVAFNTQLIPALNDLWSKHGPAVANALQQGALGLQAFFAALQGEGVTSDGFVGAMERIAVKVRALFEAIRSGDPSALSGSLSSAADSGKKLLPVVQKFIQDMPSLSDVVKVGATVLKFFADHADTLAKVMPFVVGAVIAFKIAQAGANAAMVLSIPTKIAEVVVNRQLVRSNRELIASRAALTVQTAAGTAATVANTGAESVGILTRVRAIAGIVAHRVAMVATAVATGVWTAAQWLLNVALTANPIGIVIVAIAALIAAIVFIATKTTFFQTVWRVAWGAIKAAAQAVGAWFAGPFVNFFKGAWNFLKNLVLDGVRFYIDRLVAILNFFRELPGRIKAALGNLGSLLVNAGKDLVEGLWNGIKSLSGWLAGKVRGFISDNVPGPVRKLLGISSPSRLFEDLGRDTILGYARGVQRALPALSGIGGNLLGGIGGNLLGGPRPALAGAAAGGTPNITLIIDGRAIDSSLIRVVRDRPEIVAASAAQGNINNSRR